MRWIWLVSQCDMGAGQEGDEVNFASPALWLGPKVLCHDERKMRQICQILYYG
jgi:hypothetical protein